MNKLIKLVGLVGLLTLVSCGPKSTNVTALNECINEAKCEQLAPETPEVEEQVELKAELLVEAGDEIRLGGSNEHIYTVTHINSVGTFFMKDWGRVRNMVIDGKVFSVNARTVFRVKGTEVTKMEIEVVINPATNRVTNTLSAGADVEMTLRVEDNFLVIGEDTILEVL